MHHVVGAHQHSSVDAGIAPIPTLVQAASAPASAVEHGEAHDDNGPAHAAQNRVAASLDQGAVAAVGSPSPAALLHHHSGGDGHNHVGSLARLMGPRGPVPVIGAPSASARGGTLTHKAGYHLFTIGRDETGFTLQAELRGLTPDGAIGGLGLLSLGRAMRAQDAAKA